MPVVPQYPRQDWMYGLGRDNGSRATWDSGNDKWAFRRNLMKDPKEREILYRYTKAEVGGQGREAKQSFMESVVNRADAEGKTISQVIMGKEGGGSKYFPKITHSRAKSDVGEEKTDYAIIADKVAEGSNVCNYCTGNASGNVGFAGGPLTARHGGEKYGIEGWTGKWAKSKGYTGDVIESSGTSDEEYSHREGMEEARGGKPSKKKGDEEDTGPYIAPQREYPVADMVPRMKPI
jgi:hypothetical protein